MAGGEPERAPWGANCSRNRSRSRSSARGRPKKKPSRNPTAAATAAAAAVPPEGDPKRSPAGIQLQPRPPPRPPPRGPRGVGRIRFRRMKPNGECVPQILFSNASAPLHEWKSQFNEWSLCELHLRSHFIYIHIVTYFKYDCNSTGVRSSICKRISIHINTIANQRVFALRFANVFPSL